MHSKCHTYINNFNRYSVHHVTYNNYNERMVYNLGGCLYSNAVVDTICLGDGLVFSWAEDLEGREKGEKRSQGGDCLL